MSKSKQTHRLDGDEDRRALKWLASFSSIAKTKFYFSITAGIIQSLATIAIAYLVAFLAQKLAIEQAPILSHLVPIFALFACFIIRAISLSLKEILGQYYANHIRTHLRSKILSNFYQKSSQFYMQHRPGALANQLVEQIDTLEGYYASYLPQRWLSVIIPLLIVISIVPLSWLAALIFLITAPLIPLFMIMIGWGTKAQQQKQFLAMQRMGGFFLDLIRGLPTLRLLNAHLSQAQKVYQSAESFRIHTMRVLRIAFLSGTVLEFFTSVAIALSAVYLGFALLGYYDFGFYGQHLNLQISLFILVLAPEFYQPLRDLGTHYHAKSQAIAAAIDLIQLEQNLSSAKITTPPLNLQITQATNIQLSNLHFAYQTALPILSGIDLEIHAGKCIAIVGASGQGKTSLLRLILGQLKPTEGKILVNNQDLSQISTMSWLDHIGAIDQSPKLMSASLADNLRVANRYASDQELIHALSLVNLTDWLKQLPNGLETPLGESGLALSGGQLRRLALARLSLRANCQLLILDEPTASLDNATEQLVIESLSHLIHNKTTILVSHRPAPLCLAHNVFELKQGILIPRTDLIHSSSS